MKTQLRDDKQYIILALNTVDDNFVWKHLDIKPLKELVCSYADIEERSYLLEYTGTDTVLLARCFDQESVLVLSSMQNGKRQARVLSTQSLNTMLKGDWVHVGSNKPACDAWTFDIEMGNYYIIV